MKALRARLPALRLPASLAILFGTWVVACWPWLSRRTIIGWDNVDYTFPQIRYFATQFAEGHAPWWNPFSFGGMTTIADPQGMALSPHSLLAWMLGDSYTIFAQDVMTLGCVLAGAAALMVYAARENGGSRLWALAGAIVFLLGGSATARLQHTPQVVTFACLPIALLLVQTLCRAPRLWPAALLAVFGAVLLINLNQVVLIAVYLLAPLAALHVWRSPERRRAIYLVGGAVLCAALVALPVVVATLDTLALSNRGAAVAALPAGPPSFSASLPPYMVLSLGLDGLFGFRDWPATPFWGPTDPAQDFLYIGVLPVVALLAAIILRRPAWGHGALCLALLALAFLFAMGSHTPFFPFVFTHVPGFSFSRRPADGTYFIGLFAALLVAQAGATLMRAPRAGLPWSLAVAGLLAAGAVAAWGGLQEQALRSGQAMALTAAWQAMALKAALAGVLLLALLRTSHVAWRLLAGLAVLGFVSTDLIRAGRHSVYAAVPDLYIPQAAMYRQPGRWRALDQPVAELFRFLEAGGAVGRTASYRAEFLGGPLATGVPMAFGLLNAQGYNPLRLVNYTRLFGEQTTTLAGRNFTPAAPDYASPAHRALGLRWVMVHVPSLPSVVPPPAGQRSVAAIRAELAASPAARLERQIGNYEVWELLGAGPRVQLAEAAGSCRMSEYLPTRVRISCEAASPGRAVLNDVMAAGWMACVDGAAAPIEPADGVFRSVRVPAGASEVTMRYEGIPWLRSFAGCPRP